MCSVFPDFSVINAQKKAHTVLGCSKNSKLRTSLF